MTSSIRSEDRLEGSSNFNNWKARIIAILEEHDLDQYVLTEIAEPTSAAGKATFNRNQGKARRIIYDSVRENIMPFITPLTTAKECYDTLVKLYETKATSQKRLYLMGSPLLGSYFWLLSMVMELSHPLKSFGRIVCMRKVESRLELVLLLKKTWP